MWQHIMYLCVRCLQVQGGMRTVVRIPPCTCKQRTHKYEGWNFNSGNYLFTTDTK